MHVHVHVDERSCYTEGGPYFDYQQRSSVYLPGTSYTSGHPMICDGSRYVPVCGELVNDTTAALFCSSLGYSYGFGGIRYGSPDNFYPALSNSAAIDYSCPSYAYSTSDCNFTFTDAKNCVNQGLALITCVHSYSGEHHVINLSHLFIALVNYYICTYHLFTDHTCYTGDIAINRGGGRLPGVSYFYEGPVQICHNGSYVPLCNAEFSQEFADYICDYMYGSGYG